MLVWMLAAPSYQLVLRSACSGSRPCWLSASSTRLPLTTCPVSPDHFCSLWNLFNHLHVVSQHRKESTSCTRHIHSEWIQWLEPEPGRIFKVVSLWHVDIVIHWLLFWLKHDVVGEGNKFKSQRTGSGKNLTGKVTGHKPANHRWPAQPKWPAVKGKWTNGIEKKKSLPCVWERLSVSLHLFCLVTNWLLFGGEDALLLSPQTSLYR